MQGHENACIFIMQLSHARRHQDMPGIENLDKKAQSSTNWHDPLHGFECQTLAREDMSRWLRVALKALRRPPPVRLHAR
jgi:2,4-dienoyl-CoA reductase (NADPH2)